MTQWTYLQNRSKLIDTENKYGYQRRQEREIRSLRLADTIIDKKQVLMCSTQNYILYLVINHYKFKGLLNFNYKWEKYYKVYINIYVYIYV